MRAGTLTKYSGSFASRSPANGTTRASWQGRTGDITAGVMADGADYEQVFSDVVARNFGRAAAFCGRMLNDPEQGEEVAQAAFVRLYEKGVDFATMDSPRTWLYRVMRNAVLDHLRRKGARQRAVESAAGSALRPENAQDLGKAEQSEIHAALMRAIGTLEERQREALLLRYYEGLSLVEVAKVTEGSVGSVAMMLARAKEALREKLGRLPEFKE